MAFGGRAFSGFRVIVVVLGTGILLLAGTGYWFYISQQRQYIVGRDFRLLASLASKLDGTAVSEASVIQTSSKGRSLLLEPAAILALRDSWFQRRGLPYQKADIHFEKVPQDWTRTATGRRFRFESELFLEVPLSSGEPEDGILALLKVQPVLEPLLRSRVGLGAFDAILLGTQKGEVVLGAGQAAEQLRSNGLAALLSKSTDGSKALTFMELARSITMADVVLAGVDYTLFVFPCGPSSDKDGQPLVLVGLVRAETLRSGSWAISTTLVKFAVLGLLVVMLGWPFLKLILLGDRQQVRVSDFFQLGASSVAGLAIVTIVLLDFCAYLRLNNDIDVQLKNLAGDLDAHATAEIREAYAQLECLQEKIDSSSNLKFDDGKLSLVLQRPELICKPKSTQGAAVLRDAAGADDRLDHDPELSWDYPFFETVAFIDGNGMQQVKLGMSETVPNRIPVGERDYFRTVLKGRGWNQKDFCQKQKCAFESVWSWTNGEPVAVLATTSKLLWGPAGSQKLLPVGVISIPMRSLIGPVLPPGFSFAVINDSGRVLFHSDRQRNGSENLFVETDKNRRLRAQIAAHSAEALNISYWGSEYRAYLKPMTLPDMYVVAMAQKERAWAINREWLVVAMIFVAAYLTLWLIAALATLGPNASWVWPDPARRTGYVTVSGWCVVLLAVAGATAWNYDRNSLLIVGTLVPLAGWIGTYLILSHRPTRNTGGTREPLFAYSGAAVLVLLVSGVVPGTLLFLASYQLHVRSYIKNSQLIVARRLSDRFDRLNEEYLNPVDGKANPRRLAATRVGRFRDRDLYVDFLYNTAVTNSPSTPQDSATVVQAGSRKTEPDTDDAIDRDMVLSFLEDYFPYYSEASVEWRELLHDNAGDDSWESKDERKSIRDEQIVLTSKTGSLPVKLTSWVPSIIRIPPTRPSGPDSSKGPDDQLLGGVEPHAVSTAGHGDVPPFEPGTQDSSALLLSSGMALLVLAWGLVQIFNRHIFLVGITEPLWACGQLAVNAGENVLVLCDKRAKTNQIAGITPLKLGPIVQDRDVTAAWRRALFALDESSEYGVALIDDFDDALDDARAMDRKLSLLDELVSDQSRTVILLSQVSLRGLTDSLRHSARVIGAGRHKGAPGQKASSTEATETVLERWRRVLRAFVVVERREQEATDSLEGARSSPAASETAPAPDRSGPKASSSAQAWVNRFEELRMGPVVAFLTSEGRSHPYVRRVCEDLRRSNAVKSGRLTRRQALDELTERTTHFYRGLWASCSEDEKVVLGHIAQHGLANGSVRSVVRRLLGRRLLCKDPALRPMNETFRRFVLTAECSQQVVALETKDGPSAWDRLRAPLGVAVVGVAVFLFATQKELYNAILGVTTAAAVSVPTLIRAVGLLVGRPLEGPGTRT